MTHTRNVMRLIGCFFAAGAAGTLTGALAATAFHGRGAVIAWAAVGLTTAIALGAVTGRISARIDEKADARRVARRGRDFRESVDTGLTESFDDFSRRLDQRPPETTARPE